MSLSVISFGTSNSFSFKKLCVLILSLIILMVSSSETITFAPHTLLINSLFFEYFKSSVSKVGIIKETLSILQISITLGIKSSLNIGGTLYALSTNFNAGANSSISIPIKLLFIFKFLLASLKALTNSTLLPTLENSIFISCIYSS